LGKYKERVARVEVHDSDNPRRQASRIEVAPENVRKMERGVVKRVLQTRRGQRFGGTSRAKRDMDRRTDSWGGGEVRWRELKK